MALTLLRLVALLFDALALAPALAHTLELPNKMNLAREDYVRVQQIYRGWNRLAVVVIGALISNLILAGMMRGKPKAFVLNVVAFLCLVGTQVVFWRYTYPANKATHNWTVLPEQWQALRKQWEYSHATSAGLNLIALITLALSLLAGEA
jgi:hypothetical protein